MLSLQNGEYNYYILHWYILHDLVEKTHPSWRESFAQSISILDGYINKKTKKV